MITCIALLDAWVTERTITDEKGASQTVPYTGPHTTRYATERGGAQGEECGYLLCVEVSNARRFPDVELPTDPAVTVTYAWFDDAHAAGLAWLRGEQDDFVVLAEEEVQRAGQIPSGWPE